LEISVYNDNDINRYMVFADFNVASINALMPKAEMVGRAKASISELVQIAQEKTSDDSSNEPFVISLNVAGIALSSVGTLQLQGQVLTTREQNDGESAMHQVKPSLFETPVQRLSTSGGTAPFFRLILSEEGLQEQKSRRTRNGGSVDKNYWIGKDLSHAEDEKDFYFQILRIRKKDNNNRDLTEGVGLLEKFMFDYLGVLRTEIAETSVDGGHCDLLVMRNMRNNFTSFRMVDLKMGEKTAQAGWKGKSRLRAFKHHLMDGLSNSSSEGYRLAGFNGCPKVFDSMDPLMDILTEEDLIGGKNFDRENSKGHVTTMVGTTISESRVKMINRIMLNSLDGTSVLRYFLDLHMDDLSGSNTMDCYLPIEVAEIVAHELMSQLLNLAVTCQKVKIPQKWIGSSVALAYDAGFFPNRSSEGNECKESDIRSKIIVRIFDWGRSELLAADEYESLGETEKRDRDRFWELYKGGVDRLSYNATRFYYHQFTNSTGWTDVTIQVVDFDSMSADDYIGKVYIKLPNPSDTAAVAALNETKLYKVKGTFVDRGNVYCSITWLDFPVGSRLLGAWRVTIERATNLPPKDISGTSDPYCVVMANDKGNPGQHFHQRTCIKARTLNPVWNEAIDIPVCRTTNDSSLKSALGERKIPPISDKDMSNFFQWDEKRPSQVSMNWWIKNLKEAVP